MMANGGVLGLRRFTSRRKMEAVLRALPRARLIPGFKYRVTFEWLLLAASVVVSGSLVYGVDEPWAGVMGLTMLVVCAVVVSHAELLHPFTWFGVPYFLYSVSTPLLIWMGEARDIGGLQETISLEWLAFVAFLLAVGPLRTFVAPPRSRMVSASLCWFLYVTSLALSALYLIAIWSGHYTSKLDILIDNSSPLLRLSATFSILSVAFGLLLAGAMRRRKVPWAFIGATIAWTAVAFLVSGERDYVLRTVFITVFVGHALYRRVPGRMVIPFFVVGVLVLPILGDFKNAAISGVPVEISYEDLVVATLSTELASASRNLQVLVSSFGGWSLFWGETVVWDVVRAVVPSALFGEVVPTPTEWFNQRFYPGLVREGGGVGFTLVGEGFMNFGPWGVVLWFVVLGSFVRYLYGKSSGSQTWLVVYAVTATLVIYVVRADMANLLSQFVKHIALPVSVVHVGEHVLRKLRE